MPPKMKRDSSYSEKELREMSRDEIIKETQISDREISFCEYYIRDYNARLAAIKAGYSNTSKNIGDTIRRRQRVIDYLAWLKVKIYYQANVNATDILNSYAKMAFYDITDYIEQQGNKIKLKKFDEIDGQIIQEISQSANGSITVKFPDRLKAFERLENYMSENPYDWKRKLEERKLAIMEEKLEMDKTKLGIIDDVEDDGFVEALIRASKEVWNEEDKEKQDD